MRHAIEAGAALLLLVTGTTPASADTEVFGNINREARWTVHGSPYLLVGDLTIGPNGLILIDPGVEVIAEPEPEPGEGEDSRRIELVVQGRLVIGAADGPPVVVRGRDANATAT